MESTNIYFLCWGLKISILRQRVYYDSFFTFENKTTKCNWILLCMIQRKRRSVYAIMTDVWSIIMTSNKHVQDNNFQYVNHSLQITYLFFTTLFMKGSYNVCFIERKCNLPLSIHVIVLFRYFIIKITNRFLFVWISLYAFHCMHFDNFNEYWCENQVQDSLRS